jgi:SAM-dependent methyltransferase
MTKPADAFGRAVLDWVRGGTDPEILERDDGFIDAGAGPEVYLAPFDSWPAVERQAMRLARGPVVDVGCGAGRVGLHLQDRGVDVTGIDVSAMAVRACRIRGLRRAERVSAAQLTPRLPEFQTVVLFGNNFGMFGDPTGTRRTLAAWAGAAGKRTRILAESMDPHRSARPDRRSYHRRNRERGRMPGQVRMRIRYQDLATCWFDWLFVSRAEMGRLVRGTGWHVSRFLGPKSGQLYVALLELDRDRGRTI